MCVHARLFYNKVIAWNIIMPILFLVYQHIYETCTADSAHTRQASTSIM